MTERVNKILKYYKLTSSKLADKIGVQRSSISHVLSGRNKPSLDFIQKLLKAFPDINSDWIILGKGKMITEDEEENNLFTNNIVKLSPEPVKEQTQEVPSLPDQKSLKTATIDKMEKQSTISTLNRKTDKIVIFYSDNTFQEFYPESS